MDSESEPRLRQSRPVTKSIDAGMHGELLSENERNRHKIIHTKENSELCAAHQARLTPSDSLKDRNHSVIVKPYHCGICGISFIHGDNLTQHMIIHDEDKPTKCGTYLLIQTTVKEHTCDVCEKSFTTKYQLQTHMRIHSGNKPHDCGQTCAVCRKTFSSQSAIQTHMLIHTGVKPHECGTCGKQFRHKSVLNRHILIHTGDKPHECGICGKQFRLKSTLNAHMVVHTGDKHECGTCGKYFTKGYLKRHMLIHF